MATSSMAPLATSIPSPTPSLTPAPLFQVALLIAAVEITQQDLNRLHEVWLINTTNSEKRLLFTSNISGAGGILLHWGGEGSADLYVAEITQSSQGTVIWQLYKIDSFSGEIETIFDTPQNGIPEFRDISIHGKWLRLHVKSTETLGWQETLFLNTRNNQIIKVPEYFYGFVWSPTSEDVFAHTRYDYISQIPDLPAQLVITQVPELNTIETIEYTQVDWAGEPWLVWSESQTDLIFYFIGEHMLTIDIPEKKWTYINSGVNLAPCIGDIIASPTGQWAVSKNIVRVISLDASGNVSTIFEDRLGMWHRFLAWYNNYDWIVVGTNLNTVQIYDLGNQFNLLYEINLTDYGITTPNLGRAVVKYINE